VVLAMLLLAQVPVVVWGSRHQFLAEPCYGIIVFIGGADGFRPICKRILSPALGRLRVQTFPRHGFTRRVSTKEPSKCWQATGHAHPKEAPILVVKGGWRISVVAVNHLRRSLAIMPTGPPMANQDQQSGQQVLYKNGRGHGATTHRIRNEILRKNYHVRRWPLDHPWFPSLQLLTGCKQVAQAAFNQAQSSITFWTSL
jgi:hypothetical protein